MLYVVLSSHVISLSQNDVHRACKCNEKWSKKMWKSMLVLVAIQVISLLWNHDVRYQVSKYVFLQRSESRDGWKIILSIKSWQSFWNLFLCYTYFRMVLLRFDYAENVCSRENSTHIINTTLVSNRSTLSMARYVTPMHAHVCGVGLRTSSGIRGDRKECRGDGDEDADDKEGEPGWTCTCLCLCSQQCIML